MIRLLLVVLFLGSVAEAQDNVRVSGKTVYSHDGQVFGRVSMDGKIYRNDGQSWGRVSEDGNIYRNDGQYVGRVSK